MAIYYADFVKTDAQVGLCGRVVQSFIAAISPSRNSPYGEHVTWDQKEKTKSILFAAMGVHDHHAPTTFKLMKIYSERSPVIGPLTGIKGDLSRISNRGRCCVSNPFHN